MKEAESLTSRDWYRVRRGEDEIAWDRSGKLNELCLVLFSRRALQEFAFLPSDQKELVLKRLRQISENPYGEHSLIVLQGGGRRMTRINELCVVFQVEAETEKILVSTIRGGKVNDPENVGPPPS